VKKKAKPNSIAKKGGETKALAEAVARYKAFREASAKKQFGEYDLALVATVAAQVSRECMRPEDAVKHALEILDVSRRELSARTKKLKRIINAPVHVSAVHCSFSDGVRVITNQRKRPSRGEEYFGKFLRSQMGSDAAAEELERLKRDGFTIVEVFNYLRRYLKFRRPRRQKRLTPFLPTSLPLEAK